MPGAGGSFAAAPLKPLPGVDRSPSATILSGWSKGRLRRTTASTTEKMAVVAPMPSANTPKATSVKAGVARSERTASRKSVIISSKSDLFR